MITTVPVRGLQYGDVLPGPHGWTAIADSTEQDGSVLLPVTYTVDGCGGLRVWDDPDHLLTIERQL